MLFRSGSRYAVIAVAGACIVATVAGFAAFASRNPHRDATTPSTSAALPSTASADAPLELIALEHERDGAQLIVRGIVRNPAGSLERDGLAAAVLLFGHDGALISTGRAPVPVTTLAAGAATPFVVTIPDAGDVERFRLSFRTAARLEPHVDRRASDEIVPEVAP